VTPTETTELDQRRFQWPIDCVVLIGATLLMILLRVHAFPAPLEVDECNYAYIGQRLAAGDRFYVDVWDHQPPGIFWFSAALVGLFGSGAIVFRFAAMIAAVGTLNLVYLICRRSLGRMASGIAAILFALASSDPGVAGEGCNREIYMNLLAAAAVLLLLGGNRWRVLIAGICLGLASLLKTVVITQWLSLLIGLIAWRFIARTREQTIDGGRRGPAPGGTADARESHGAGSQSRTTRSPNWLALDTLRSLALFAGGAAIVWILVCAMLIADGRFDSFIDATFVYNVGYGQLTVPIAQKIAGFFMDNGELRTEVFRSAAPVWIVGLIGLFALPWRRDPRFAITIAAFTLGSFLAVCLPGRFWNHYYMLTLPPMVIASAALIDRVARIGVSVTTGVDPRVRGAAIAIGVVVIATLAACQWHYYLDKPADQIAAFRYHGRMVWSRDHGLRVKQVTDPNDTIYVAGLDAGIYYYSQRKGASRYTMVTHLAGDDSATEKRRRRLADDLRDHKPRLILIVAAKTTPFIPQLDRFIREHQYVKVGEDPGRMIVLCDPKRPIATIAWQSQSPISPAR